MWLTKLVIGCLLIISSKTEELSSAPSICPKQQKYGNGPPSSCPPIIDPNNRPSSVLENWFTRGDFSDLFPYANIGWGPQKCFPYNYDSFIIAARYFPEFGASSPKNGLSAAENFRRDLAAFFAHAIQETGQNDISVYTTGLNTNEADECFYRGGLFNWFEGGPISSLLNKSSPGFNPEDGTHCITAGRYCSNSTFYPCQNDGCYFGRGAIQISYNYNYGQFQEWLATQNIFVDLLANPNLIMTKRDPPLALMASLWFYMTPQPPKPSMHDIVLGEWHAGKKNVDAGYWGPIFGPTSLIINNECNGLDGHIPGGGGENRRILAFKWFCNYFGVSAGENFTLSCKGMPEPFDRIPQNQSYQPDWSSTWKQQQCNCAPAPYGGYIPYFEPGFYPQQFVNQNPHNHARCIKAIYDNPAAFGLDIKTSPCLLHLPQTAETKKKIATAGSRFSSYAVKSNITSFANWFLKPEIAHYLSAAHNKHKKNCNSN